MEQLLMRWNCKNVEIPEMNPLYLYHQFYRGGDAFYTEERFQEEWMRVIDNPKEKALYYWHWYYDDVRIPDDAFFLVTDKDKHLAATAACQIGEHLPGTATLHMVKCDPNHIGKGLGRVVTVAAMQYAFETGIEIMYLTTDDFRIPAIKLYLQLGWIPEINSDEMLNRWCKIARDLKLEKLTICDKYGKKAEINISEGYLSKK